MIKINLAKKKQPAPLTQDGTGFVQNKPGLRDKLEDFRGFPIRKILLPVVAAYLASSLVDEVKVRQLKKADQKVAALKKEQTALAAKLATTKGFEKIKEQLAADEATLKNKITAIEKLITGRTETAKMMMALSDNIPEDLWLTEFGIVFPRVTLKGKSLDYNLISDFMRNLGDSAYFRSLVLKTTEQKTDVKTGVDIATFELGARRKGAGQDSEGGPNGTTQ